MTEIFCIIVILTNLKWFFRGGNAKITSFRPNRSYLLTFCKIIHFHWLTSFYFYLVNAQNLEFWDEPAGIIDSSNMSHTHRTYPRRTKWPLKTKGVLIRALSILPNKYHSKSYFFAILNHILFPEDLI
jgi:hypothetical protein